MQLITGINYYMLMLFQLLFINFLGAYKIDIKDMEFNSAFIGICDSAYVTTTIKFLRNMERSSKHYCFVNSFRINRFQAIVLYKENKYIFIS